MIHPMELNSTILLMFTHNYYCFSLVIVLSHVFSHCVTVNIGSTYVVVIHCVNVNMSLCYISIVYIFK